MDDKKLQLTWLFNTTVEDFTPEGEDVNDDLEWDDCTELRIEVEGKAPVVIEASRDYLIEEHGEIIRDVLMLLGIDFQEQTQVTESIRIG